MAAMGCVAASKTNRNSGSAVWRRREADAFGNREPGTGPVAGSTIPDPGFDEYVSDPAHPVPYRQRPIQATYFPGGSKWSTWLVEDQRFVDDRNDVLSYETSPLDNDV